MMNQPPVLLDSYRLKIVQVHALIKWYKYQAPRPKDMCKRLVEMLEEMYSNNLSEEFSQRKMIGAYDILRNVNQSEESFQVKMSPTMLILKSVYGPMYGLRKLQDYNFYRLSNVTNQFEKSMKLFSQNFENLQTHEYYFFVNIFQKILGNPKGKVKMPKLFYILK